MGTMWRNTTVKSRRILSCGSLLLAGIALQPALVAAPGIAQVSGTQSTSLAAPPGSGSVSSSAKSGLTGQGSGPIVLPKDFSEIRIEPGDLLSVNVYDTPELTDAYRVDPAGDLTLPLCGKVKVQGLTSPEVAKLLETTLVKDQILNQPQVSVDVQQYAGHFVTDSESGL